MSRDREIACKYYIAEGICSKGRDGTFYHYCQKCSNYEAIKGGRPARKNLKREKTEKVFKRLEKLDMNTPILNP